MINLERAREMFVPGTMLVANNRLGDQFNYLIVSCGDVRRSDVDETTLADKCYVVDVLLFVENREVLQSCTVHMINWFNLTPKFKIQRLLGINECYVCHRTTYSGYTHDIVDLVRANVQS